MDLAKSCSIAEARERVGATARSMLFETASSRGGEPGRTLLFESPVAWLSASRLSELPRMFAEIEEARRSGLWVAGYLAYECGYHWEPSAWRTGAVGEAARPGNARPRGDLPLAMMGVYEVPVLCSAAEEDRGAALGVTNLSYSCRFETFAERFERIQEWIAAGDTYQVNLTFQLESVYRGDAASLFNHMMRTQPVPFAAMLNLGTQTILSASPELFFHQEGRRIKVRPMKGTLRRGADADEDERLASALAADEKNRAENVMIVDLLRNDLGRIAEIGSVRASGLFAVERHPSLLQMTSQVDAVLRGSVNAYGVFASLFPSGSIVGAPKVRTMQLIRALEGVERGPYTGAIGLFSPHDEAVFSVAIRTAVLCGERLTMGVGAGITSGSVASEEYEECMLKARFLQEPEFNLVESMRWEQGCCTLLGRHLDRIGESAEFFGFRFDRERVQGAILQETAHYPVDGAYKVRLEMSVDGVCSFAPPERIEGDGENLRAVVWPVPADSRDVWLRHKTTRRPIYDQAFRRAREAGFVDAIFTNETGCVTEGTIHSVFVRHGERWRTPPLEAGVLPGVSRRVLLSQMPQMEEVAFGTEELMSADEVWLVNAVRGLRRLVAGGVSPGFTR